MATATLVAPVSSDEFLRLYDREDNGIRKFELIDGEVVERPMTNRVHDAIKNDLAAALILHFQTDPNFVALVETTFKLSPRMTFTPDLAVIDRLRWREMNEPFAIGAPDIAFEVISSDTADRLMYKTEAYLAFGSKAVCWVYPNQRRITVKTVTRTFEFTGNDPLEFPDILPGFSVPLPTIFQSAH